MNPFIETLVHDHSFELSGSFEQDLPLLQSLVTDDAPAYVLVRLDQPSTDWLAVTYIPETAKVRDKVSDGILAFHAEKCNE
jgi:twinfilin